MAAKLPAAATTAVAWAGASRLASRTAQPASPAPRAISGASGPSTAPRLRVTSAAMAMPGTSVGDGTPPALNPSAGEWPPLPGRYRMVRATRTPARVSSGSGHHHGAPPRPRASGRSLKSHSWRPVTSARKP
jgi:hypothetical protein